MKEFNYILDNYRYYESYQDLNDVIKDKEKWENLGTISSYFGSTSMLLFALAFGLWVAMFFAWSIFAKNIESGYLPSFLLLLLGIILIITSFILDSIYSRKIKEFYTKMFPNVREIDYFYFDNACKINLFVDIEIDTLRKYKDLAENNDRFKNLLNNIVKDRGGRVCLIDYLLLSGTELFDSFKKTEETINSKSEREKIISELLGN